MGYRNIIVGIDLNMDLPQVCYFDMVGRKTGARPLKIGNLQVKLRDLLGKEDQLSDPQTIRTLAGILREALATVGISDIQREIHGFMFTVKTLSKEMVALLRAVFEQLGIPRSKAYMQDYKESFYYYTMYQKQEIWKHNTALFEIYDQDQVRFYALGLNRKTNPVSVTVREEELGSISSSPDQRGHDLANLLRQNLDKDIYSSVFVTGDTLAEDWSLEAKKVLVKGGRLAFTEEYFFARGACFAAREKADERRIQGLTYAGDTLVRDNVGMNMQVGDRTAYYPLISAGAHWYNARHDCEFILGDQNRIVFVISSSRDGGRRLYKLDLPGLPERPERTSRIHLHLEFENRNHCRVTVEDMGFGEMFPSSGLRWTEILEGVR